MRTYNDLPGWFKAILETAGSDAAGWPAASGYFEIPQFIQDMLDIAYADPASWYNLSTVSGAFETVPDYYQGILEYLGPPVPALTTIMEDQCSGVSATVSGRTPDTVQYLTNLWAVGVDGTTTLVTDGAGEFRYNFIAGSARGSYEIGATSYTYTLDITPNTWAAGLIEYASFTKHFEIGIRSGVGATDGLILRFRNGGATVVDQDYTGDFVAGTKYPVTVTVTPTTITATSGTASISYARTVAQQYTATKVGCTFLSPNNLGRISNIKVQA